ncbi:MAG: transglutaminase-like domain-containing protein [Candidatus Helarchaeota archaeon]
MGKNKLLIIGLILGVIAGISITTYSISTKDEINPLILLFFPQHTDIKYESIIGLENVSGENTTINLYFAIIPNITSPIEVQTVREQFVRWAYIGSAQSTFAEINNISPGYRQVHIRLENVTNGTIILFTHSAYVTFNTQAPLTLDSIPNTPIPSNSSEYPQNVRKFLNLTNVDGFENTTDLRSFLVNNLTTANTFRQAIYDIVMGVYEAFPYDSSRTEGVLNGTMTAQSYPGNSVRTPTEVLSNETGVCVEFARFVTSMMRLKNIPARTATMFEPGMRTHTFTQVYVSGIGWFDVDSTSGKCPKPWIFNSKIPYLLLDPDENDYFSLMLNTTPGKDIRLLGENEAYNYLVDPVIDWTVLS